MLEAAQREVIGLGPTVSTHSPQNLGFDGDSGGSLIVIDDGGSMSYDEKLIFFIAALVMPQSSLPQLSHWFVA